MNDSAWANPDYDALIAQAAKEVDEKKRFEILFRAEEILLDQVPVIPIFYYVSNYLISPRVKGFEFNVADQPVFKGVDILPEAKK